MGERLARKVLLVGWDAADWKLITPLLDQGLMPTLESVIDTGVMGNLATLRPILSPMLWNSIATGKRADQHGIRGFIEPDPQTGGVRPVSSTSRRVKAIWNILSQRGLRTHVIGWFAGHPAEPINGVAVSPLHAHPSRPLGEPWVLPEGAVHPAALHETLAALRVHPGSLTAATLLPFVPRAAEVDQDRDRHLAGLARILAECCTIHNAATWILENEPWDFLAVYYNAIDHTCHGFMPFHPPRMDGVDPGQYELYKDVVNGMYLFHDMLLNRLLELAGPDATVVLVSDHGFHSDHLRPRATPEHPTGPAVWHRDLGVICLRGPHIRQDERIYGATLLDVTPTVLTLFGLPVGADMVGKVLVQTFADPVEPERIPSWEAEPGECGMHPADLRMDPDAAQAVLEQFVALGYIQPPSEDQAKARAVAIEEGKYNLALDHLDARRPRDARPLLEELVAQKPAERRFRLDLAQCYLSLGQRAEARTLLEGLMEEGEAGPRSDWLMGVIQFEEGNTDEALAHLLRAEAADPRLPTLHLRIGRTYLRKRRWEEAGRAFDKALAIDPDSPRAHLGLAMVALRQRRHEAAAEHALAAVGLQHLLPGGHYYLGVALARLGQLPRAALAFETAVAMQPGLVNGHRWLSAIYLRTGDLVRAAEHRVRADELRRRRRRGAAAA
jgi:tetratricopeptide (TPR) repeat protein